MAYRNSPERLAYMKDYQKKWEARNREKINAKSTKWRREHPEIVKYWRRRVDLKRYGLTIEQYEDMRKKQDNVCALCKKSPKYRRLCVDHDHRTKVVRGLLCDGCNWAVGAVESRVPILDLIFYLWRGHPRKKEPQPSQPSEKFYEEM